MPRRGRGRALKETKWPPSLFSPQTKSNLGVKAAILRERWAPRPTRSLTRSSSSSSKRSNKNYRNENLQSFRLKSFNFLLSVRTLPAICKSYVKCPFPLEQMILVHVVFPHHAKRNIVCDALGADDASFSLLFGKRTKPNQCEFSPRHLQRAPHPAAPMLKWM